ncbi:MAG: flavodoxin-dependent (E)-4-hydroxy-3-methylbut-2-enyl-diphosphate synthase [Eubacteriales bacterium]
MSQKQISVGGVRIGGGAKVSIQSMTNTPTHDVEKTLAQIRALATAGCEVVRLAVPDMEAALAIEAIKQDSPLPIVVDIHFDYRLALACIERGADKVRINPGNIGDSMRVKEVALSCKKRNIPIRIGVNGGSLEKEILGKYGKVTAQGLVDSAFSHIALLNQFDFDDICISLKSSSVPLTMKAYEIMARESDYPLHLGITEAGTMHMGTIKSAIGIGGLLALDIGDTLRVTLTADPVAEIAVAKDILKAVGLRKEGVELIACPSCGRTKIDLISLAEEVERGLADISKPLTVAVMGCMVNGPGEAKAADCGIAGGDGEGLLFAKGEIIKKVPQEQLVAELFALIETLSIEEPLTN